MAKQTIDLGTGELTGDGESLRSAFDKINDNFTENYTTIADHESRIDALEDGQVTTDIQGSVFSDNSTLLVDGVNSSINLDGTVKGNIIPDTNIAYDIGSSSKRFKDLWLSGTTINLGSSTLSTVGGELSLDGIKIPTTADLASGITINATGDVKGSVFADDSTLLVDAVNGTINLNGPARYTDPTTGYESSLNLDYDFNVDTEFSSIYLAGNGEWRIGSSTYSHNIFALDPENDSGVIIEVGPGNEFHFGIDGSLTVPGSVTANRYVGDITGSVFADDSTNIIDGITGKINAPAGIALSGIGGSEITIGQMIIYDSGIDTNNGNTLTLFAGADLQLTAETNVSITSAVNGTFKTWDFGTDGTITFPDATVQSTAWNGVGDLTGSVFGDDSTLLVDGVNNIIPKANIESSTDWDAAFAWGDHAMAGYQSANAPFTGDVTGSVFADDSTLLVDAVNGVIPGYVKIADLKTALQDGAGDYAAFKAWVLANL